VYDFRVDPSGLQWLEADLQIAASAPNRAAQPWIVFNTHRPLYCSITHDACTKEAAGLRAKLESLLLKYGVDLVITGHVHDYERMYAIDQGAVASTNYVNPGAPVYIVNGASGNHEGLDNQWQAPPPAWSAYRASEFGFGILTVLDAQHLQWEFIRDSDYMAEDGFVITKS